MGDSPEEISPFDDSNLLLGDVLRSSLDVIIATDHERRIRLFNPAAKRAQQPPKPLPRKSKRSCPTQHNFPG